MPESPEAQTDLAYIRTHVDNLERMVRFQISSNPESRNVIREHLKTREGAAQMYLALDEPKTQAELQAHLGISQSNVSRILSHLRDAGLVIKIPSPAGRQIVTYMRSDLETILKVSRIARELLKSDGPKANKPARRGPKEVPDHGPVAAGGTIAAGDPSE